MSQTTNINLRLDKDLKSQAEQLFAKLGINMTTAFNIFLRQAVREQCIPFKVTADVPHSDAYITSMLRDDELKVAEGTMKYYTEDEVFSEMEAIIHEARERLDLHRKV